jgi:uncharacterized protein YtpQ (UPF0354 family)
MRKDLSRTLLGGVVLAFCLLACRERLLTTAEFTQAHVSAWRQKHPDVNVEVVKDLELRVVGTSGTLQTSLQRSYEAYVQEPERLTELVDRFVAGQAESLKKLQQEVATERILPVIKTRKWLAGRAGSWVHEDFSSDLIIVYGQDFPDTIRYLAPPDLAAAGLTQESLRPLAVKNLLESLKIEHHSYECCRMLTAGGDYEASLILADSILRQYQDEMKGSLVVAIPSPGLFLLTGSEDAKGLALLQKTIAEQREDGTLLTSRLFLYKDGTLTEMPAEE